MKNLLIAFSLAAGFIACNNKTEESHDEAAHHNDTSMHGSASGHMYSSAGGNTMMVMMQKNMDEMKNMETSKNPDQDFAKMMRVHHMGAVEMIEMELAKGTDQQMKQMAQKMKAEQQKEIEELRKHINIGSPVANGDAFHKEVVEQMNKVRMGTDHSGSVDKQFAAMMIAHHQGAIDMSQSYLKTGAKNAKLKAIANSIISDQQKEIAEMEAWLKK